MITLTPTQLGLLHCCYVESGPSLKEFFEFGPSYGVSLETLRKDYIFLLYEHLILPISFIHLTTYLPSACLVTKKGEDYLHKIQEDEPDRIPLRVITLDFTQKELDWEAVWQFFPSINESDLDEIAMLSETYLYWAKYPPKNTISIPQEELFYAAAKGFVKLDDIRHLFLSIRELFSVLEEKGDYTKLVYITSQLIGEFPCCRDIILETVAVILERPYWNLTGKAIPKLIDAQSYSAVINEMIDVATQTGKGYEFKHLDGNSLRAISNRIEDILEEAFRTSNESLYLQLCRLEDAFIRLIRSMVKISEETKDFESRSGYLRRVQLAEKCNDLLTFFPNLVRLEESLKEDAYNKTLEIIQIIHRGVAFPVWRICDFWDSDEERSGHWIFCLLGFSESRMRADLFRLLNQLEKMYENLRIEKSSQRPSIQSLIDQSSIEEDIKYIRMKVDELDKGNSSKEEIRSVQMLFIEEKLSELLVVSQTNQAYLRSLCETILNSEELLLLIDSKLNEKLPEIQRDIENLKTSILESTILSEEDRKTFLSGLDKVAKFSSAGKIIASVHLIPGFLKYQVELGISANLNKWIGMIISYLNKN